MTDALSGKGRDTGKQCRGLDTLFSVDIDLVGPMRFFDNLNCFENTGAGISHRLG